MNPITFKINGEPYSVDGSSFPVETKLIEFIRNHANLRGTKFMCLEGGCGACLVSVKIKDPSTNLIRIESVNSCLKLLYSCDGLEIKTIEGIGNKKIGYHSIQKHLNKYNGSQCGFCSPGMIVNMFSLLKQNDKKLTMEQIESSFGGNICRCTGYRSILDAFKCFATDVACKNIDLDEMDIEDLAIDWPREHRLCADTCSKVKAKPFNLKSNGKQWFKVTELKEIFDIFSTIDDASYMLVAGNTAHGVYHLDEETIMVFIDVSSVPKLHKQSISTEIRLGGNVTLTQTIEIMNSVDTTPGFEYCSYIAEHINRVANVPVRNTGTLAGNLSIKHAHNEFPSDIFIILEGCGAKLIIADSVDLRTEVTPFEYLSLEMNKKCILKVVFPQLGTGYKFRSYKIMIRAQNANAYVNAAFLIQIENQQIKSARICFGGINPQFTHAYATESYLIGKNLYENDILQGALACLSNELIPDWVLPDASPEYRKNLALALFYRFALSTCPMGTMSLVNVLSSQPMIRPLSSGVQSFDTFKSKWPLTEPVVKYAGILQCSGEAQFINDIPKQQDELWAAFATADKVHFIIESIDASLALAIPGVRFFYAAADIPGKNNFTPKAVYTSYVEQIFVEIGSEVLFNGQPVGVIVADTMELAVKAAKKVNILYVQSAKLSDTKESKFSMSSIARSLLNPILGQSKTTQPPIIPTIREAHERYSDKKSTEETNYVGHRYGATQTVNGSFEIYGQYHFSMETQTTLCVPAENGMDVHCSTQWVDFTQVAIADCLNIPENNINMNIRRIGGAFGAKISRATQIACACAIACYRSYRPIRFVMTIEANMETIGKRYGISNDYTIEIDDKGKILSLVNNYMQDYGCSLNEDVSTSTTPLFSNCYDSTGWKVTDQKVLTDAASNTFCRAPGTLEGVAMIENIMEHIARVTGEDPMDVRIKNCTSDSPIRTISKAFLEDIDYVNRKQKCETFNKYNRWRKRGIAVVPMAWPLIYYGVIPAFVAIYHHDGSVVVTHGGIECGQGINTKVAQVTAHTLGVPLDKVSIRPMDNVVSANAVMTASSCTSEMTCYAVKKACEELVVRMKPVKDTMPANYKWADLTEACYQQEIDLRATYQFKDTDVGTYNIYGMAAAEMLVDILTGNYIITRVDILEDVGESMSPNIDVGQIEGGFIMGIGYWLTEELIYDRTTGKLLTNRTWNYKPPGAMDIPVDFRVKFLKNSPNPMAGVLRSKAVAEPPTCMSVVVIFALRNALDSARKDAGITEIWFPMGSATTPEKVFLSAGNSTSAFTY